MKSLYSSLALLTLLLSTVVGADSGCMPLSSKVKEGLTTTEIKRICSDEPYHQYKITLQASATAKAIYVMIDSRYEGDDRYLIQQGIDRILANNLTAAQFALIRRNVKPQLLKAQSTTLTEVQEGELNRAAASLLEMILQD